MKHFALVLCASGLTTAAQAQDISIFEAAIVDAETRADAIGDARYSFEKIVQKNGETFSLRFDANDEVWSLASGDSDLAQQTLKQYNKALEGAEETPDRGALMDDPREAFGDSNPQYLRDDGDAWVFSITLDEGLGMSGGGKNADVSKYLKGEIYVAKDESRFMAFRFYSEQPFKPAPVARINKMDVRVDFEPIGGPAGPLAVSAEYTDVSGSALFQKFSEQEEATYSGYQLLTR